MLLWFIFRIKEHSVKTNTMIPDLPVMYSQDQGQSWQDVSPDLTLDPGIVWFATGWVQSVESKRFAEYILHSCKTIVKHLVAKNEAQVQLEPPFKKISNAIYINSPQNQCLHCFSHQACWQGWSLCPYFSFLLSILQCKAHACYGRVLRSYMCVYIYNGEFCGGVSHERITSVLGHSKTGPQQDASSISNIRNFLIFEVFEDLGNSSSYSSLCILESKTVYRV